MPRWYALNDENRIFGAVESDEVLDEPLRRAGWERVLPVTVAGGPPRPLSARSGVEGG